MLSTRKLANNFNHFWAKYYRTLKFTICRAFDSPSPPICHFLQTWYAFRTIDPQLGTNTTRGRRLVRYSLFSTTIFFSMIRVWSLGIEDVNATATYMMHISPIVQGLDGRIVFRNRSFDGKSKAFAAQCSHLLMAACAVLFCGYQNYV